MRRRPNCAPRAHDGSRPRRRRLGPPRSTRRGGRLLRCARPRGTDAADDHRDPRAADELIAGPVTLTTGEMTALAEQDYPSVRAALADAPAWTRYPLGVALVLVRHGVIDAPTGRLSIDSNVPISAGVSSSAALECGDRPALGAEVEPLRLARLCQEAENHVVGAPCGIMDQVAVTIGAPVPCSRSCADRCPSNRPLIFRMESRCAAGPPIRSTRSVALPTAEPAPPRSWGSASPKTTRACVGLGEPDTGRAPAELPESLAGADFVDRWATVDDPLADIDPALDYPVRAATASGEGASPHWPRPRRAEARWGSRTRPAHGGQPSGLQRDGARPPRNRSRRRRGPGDSGRDRRSGQRGGSGGTVVVLCERGALDDLVAVIR